MGIRGSKFRDEILNKYKDVLQELEGWTYTHYINNLRKEIKEQKWKNTKYEKFLKEKGWDGNTSPFSVDQICLWEKVQQDIFQAVMDNYSTTPFTWEDEAKGLLTDARKTHFQGQTCDKVYDNLNSEIEKPISKHDTTCDSHIIEGLCIPQRRENFNLKNFNKTLFDILSSNNGHVDTRVAILAVTGAIGGLANQVTDGIVDLKTTYSKSNKEICTLMRRTYADAKDILNAKDIYDNKTSKDLQCMLKNIRKYLEDNNIIDELMKKHFEESIENKLKSQNVYEDDSNNKTQCNLDHSDYTEKPQCLRFFEEWFEEFMQQKKKYEERMKQTCLEGKIITQNIIGGKITAQLGCSFYCNEYNKFLSSRKECYRKYITNCKNKRSKDRKPDTIMQTQLDATIRQMKNKYDCSDNDCGKDGSEKLDPFFDPKKLSVNEIYCCGCINDPNDIYNVFRTKNNESSYIDAILNKLSICAPRDNDLSGATDGKIIIGSGNGTNICDINFANSFLRGTGTCSEVPCNNYYKNVKQWICASSVHASGERLKNGWSDGTGSACLPPRTQRLCLGRIYSNSCTTQNIDNIDSNEKLLNELVIASRFEGTQLHNKYITEDKNNRTEEEKKKRLCNDAIYSFADLGDVVKGTSIWENNDTSSMENNLKTIFGKIYNKLDNRNQDKYKDTDNDVKYRKLREVWWNTNRQHIWKALVCGIKFFKETKSISCIKEDEPPNIDYMPQFLRWLTEWTGEFCEERNKRLNELVEKCNICKDVKNGGSYCKSKKCMANGCQDKCKEYKTWIKDKYDFFKKQKNKLDSVIKTKDENIYKKFLKDDKISSFFLNYLKKNICNDIHKFDDTNAFMEVPHDCECNTSLGSVDTNGNVCINPISPGVCNEINSRIFDDNLSNEKCSGIESDKDIKWRNNNTPEGDNFEGRFNKQYKNIPTGVEVSPRRHNLCIAKLSEMLKDQNKRTEEELKNALLEDVVNESYNISKYLKSGINAQYKVEANNALKYSFFDYKNIIEGTDLIENHNNDGINSMLNKIFGNKNGNPREKRKNWWKENEDCVRQAMLCGYQEGRKESGPPDQKLLPDNDNTPQFLYWVQEWYEDFCSKRHKKNKSVESLCKDNENNFECNKCIEECKKYKEFLDIKKREWNNQKYYYDQYHKSQNNKSLQDYLKIHSSGLEGCETTGGKSDLDTLFNNTYGDKESFCGCDAYEQNTYNRHSGEQNCGGLLRFKQTKWMDNKTKDDQGRKHFTKLPDNMYVSARRQGLCIKGIDNIEIDGKSMDEKKKILRKHLLDVAAVEGYNIGKYYKQKNDANFTKYTYSVKECNALKYSFYDFRNIVIGKDYLELREDQKKEPTPTEASFLKSFSRTGTPNGSELENMTQNRTDFWNENKQCFWNAMLCGYKKGREEPNLPTGCNPYKIPTEENTPQFLLWLTEWGEDFYEQRQKKIEQLKKSCEECRMKKNSDPNQQTNSQKCNPKDKCGECKKKCGEYKEWIDKWKKQWGHLKTYYDEQKEKNDNEFKNYVTSDDLSHYVVKKLKDIGYSNITSFDTTDAFVNYPSGFQNICPCEPTDISSSRSIDDEDNCNDNFKSQWKCDETPGKTKKRNMCVRENDSRASNSGSDFDMLFFNSFTQWLDEMLYNMKENTNTLSQTCNTKNIDGKDKKKCNECQKNCTCYKDWKQKIDAQWGKQQKYFDDEREKPDSTMNGLLLNEFLEAYCLTKDENRQENECSPQDTNKTIIDEKLEAANTRNTNVCGICPDDPTNNKHGGAGDNCDNSGTSALTGICMTKEYDNIKIDGKYNKEWTKEATNKENKTDKDIRVPPRRQQLCISYLVKNNIDSEEKFKNVLIKTIKSETEKLYQYYKNGTPVNTDNTKKVENDLPVGFCKALERSFADLGDFVKGSDLDYTQGDTATVKNKLDTLFNDKSKITVNRKHWWEQNKRELWKAVNCGINDGKNDLNCPQNLDFDRRDQFLRWFEEWGEYVCKEHTKELEKLTSGCSKCNNKCANGNGCKKQECETACNTYKAWIQKRRDQWKHFLGKYDKNKTKYKDDEDEATFWAKHMPASTYLKFFNIDTCSKTLFKTLFYEDFDYGDQQELCECDEKKHDMENADETDLPAPDDITSNPCKVHNEISTCHEKEFDGVPWTSRNIRTDENGQRIFGVYAPPRRQKLCVGNIWQHATDKITLLNELLLAAKKEGEYLKKYYESKQSGGKGSSDNNKEFCKALERSFYDLGDIVKGTDVRRGAIVMATENKIHSIFKNGGNSGGVKTLNDDDIKKEREKWWEYNKKKVWEAMNCNNTCTTTVPSDSTPQLLRWYEEWYEDFCQQRQKLLIEIQTTCRNKKPTDPCTGNEKCESACSQYSNWLTPKKFEWRAQKKNYETRKRNEHIYGIEFQNSTKGKTTIENYLNDKFQCDKTKIDEMDKIVEKVDDDYKTHYEPLCSKCRMKKIIDKAKEKKNQQKKIPTSPSSIIENICKNPNNICAKLNDKGLIKVPIDSDNSKNDKRNREKNGLNCGGIPSDKTDIKWVGQKDHYTWLSKLDTNIYVSPRRRTLCSNGIDQLNSLVDLKERLLTVAANDAYNLGIKYNDYENHYGVKPCKALQYSFNDYKHIILGTDNLEPETNGTEINMKKLFRDAYPDKANAGQSNSEKRKDWWNANKKCVWDVMVCGYKKGKVLANQNNPNGNIPELNSQEGGGTYNKCDIPKDEDSSDQFLSWLKEWYEDFCHIRTKLKSEVQQNCKVSEENYYCKKCTKKCEEYKEYMKKKKNEWDSLEKYYDIKKNGKNGQTNGYTEKDAKDYLKTKLSAINGAASCAEIQKNIELFKKQSYYDLDEHCTCEKYNDAQIYQRIVGQNNCRGLEKEATTASGIKWIHDDGGENKYLGDRGLTEHVYVPPRRQKLCFEGLDNLAKGSDENKLRNQFIKLFAGEGYNLGEYYKEKEKNNSKDKYSYDVAPCNAMKYSFYDLRDIILGHDMVEPEGYGTENNLKEIFKKHALNGDTDIEEKRNEFWEQNKECFWEAMICGYRKGRDYIGNSGKSGDDLKDCDKCVPNDFPIGLNRTDGRNLQFLRWFAEWSEDFCRKQNVQKDNLVKVCATYTCSSSNNGEEMKCKNACDNYKQFIEQWKAQYLKQSEKYYKDRIKQKYDSNPSVKEDVNSSQQAYKYLNKSLEKICGKNGLTCNCMEKESKSTSSNQRHSGNGTVLIENYDTHMPASLDTVPDGYTDKCTCPSQPAAKKPGTTPKPPDGRSSTTNTITENTLDGKGSITITTNTSSQGNTPEPTNGSVVGPDSSSTGSGSGGGRSPPPSAPSSSSKEKKPDEEKGKGTKPDSGEEEKYIPEPKDPMNCIEKSAYYVGKEAENALDKNTKLKGNKPDDVCKKQQNPSRNGSSCTITNTTSNNGHIYTCDVNGNPFDDKNVWECNNPTNKVTKEDICIPPRRKHMCTEVLKDLNTSINSTEEMLKNVLHSAANEGKHLNDTWNKTNEESTKLTKRPSIKRYELCDAMKYSFADLGDIIRGRDIYIRDNNKLEHKLKKVFENIQKEDAHFTKKYPNLPSFRSAWWDANRVSIWKAMTCCAPDNYFFLKRGKGDGSGIEVLTSSKDNNCGHDKEPPYDDYIPQGFRWISEWSEHFCLYQNHLLETMRNCANCSKNSNKCEQIKHGACKECKGKCDKYKEFVEYWKKQYGVLEKAYKNVYNKEIENSPKAKGSSNTNEAHIKDFVEKLKDKCKNDKLNTTNSVNSVDKYLDKGNYCNNLKFVNANTNDQNYAFNDPTSSYKESCECAKNFEEVDQCPVDTEECKKYDRYHCQRRRVNKNPIEWTNELVKKNISKYESVMVPPRRKHLCFRRIKQFSGWVNDEKRFKEFILNDASNEARNIWEIYGNNHEKALEAMKYSFADIGNIVKGDDLLEDLRTRKLKEIFERIQKNKNKENGHNSNTDDITKIRQTWWTENKHKVWNVMMCNYHGNDKKDKHSCPSHDNIDEEDQFLRWMTEWAKYFCKEKKKEVKVLIEKCKTEIEEKIYSNVKQIQNGPCKDLLNTYNYWFYNRSLEWENFDKKYKEDYTSNSTYNLGKMHSSADEYLRVKCPECKCDFEKIKETYEQTGKGQGVIANILKKEENNKINHDDTSKDKSTSHQKTDKDKKKEDKNIVKPAPHAPEPNPPVPVIPTPQQDEPSVPINNILTSTLPVGISFVLGSIALLFYMKKKPILRPTKLFRVIDIPQNDYEIPTNKSSNRYIPYGQYKGKTYIYVEGEETDDYIRDISSSDITSSSESEYEEMDINDIYPYKSPKYKTLIEVVLKPSINNNVEDTQNTHIGHMEDKPTNTPINDNEWNQLKQDFILKYLQNHQKDLPNENITDDNMYKDIQPNALHFDNHDEKPFITQIHDRFLDNSREEVTYNIDWNIPKQNEITNNSIDDLRYVSSNDKYSGMDLINDSLNSDQHIDIYDELLKRKENELYGTKHTKKKNSNIFATHIYDDPIMNQLNLYHKWLDRHRNMCNQWNNKEEMLHKLTDEWNKENNEHILDISSTHDDINKNNDEKHNMISKNIHQGNDITFPENFGSTNIPHNDILIPNNSFQTKKLRTHISMDIHFDENNNTSDNHLENFYNF